MISFCVTFELLRIRSVGLAMDLMIDNGGAVAEWSKVLPLREKMNERQKISVSFPLLKRTFLTFPRTLWRPSWRRWCSLSSRRRRRRRRGRGWRGRSGERTGTCAALEPCLRDFPGQKFINFKTGGRCTGYSGFFPAAVTTCLFGVSRENFWVTYKLSKQMTLWLWLDSYLSLKLNSDCTCEVFKVVRAI